MAKVLVGFILLGVFSGALAQDPQVNFQALRDCFAQTPIQLTPQYFLENRNGIDLPGARFADRIEDAGETVYLGALIFMEPFNPGGSGSSKTVRISVLQDPENKVWVKEEQKKVASLSRGNLQVQFNLLGKTQEDFGCASHNYKIPLALGRFPSGLDRRIALGFQKPDAFHSIPALEDPASAIQNQICPPLGVPTVASSHPTTQMPPEEIKRVVQEAIIQRLDFLKTHKDGLAKSDNSSVQRATINEGSCIQAIHPRSERFEDSLKSTCLKFGGDNSICDPRHNSNPGGGARE